MPEHLKALIVILVITTSVFYVAKPLAIQVVSAETFSRWRAAWFFLTLSWFLSHSFWIYALLLVISVRYLATREQNTLGLFLVLLFVAPSVSMNLSGLGVVNQLFPVNHFNLLLLALLLPMAIKLSQRRSHMRLGESAVDKMVLGYFVITCALAFRDASITGGLRTVFLNVINVFIPYYVASRSLRSTDDFRHALFGLSMGAALVSAIALFEVLRYWKLYQGVLVVMGFPAWQVGWYLERAGVLRPEATLGNSIVLGYLLMIAAGCYLFLMAYMSPGWQRRIGLGLLVGGVIWSLSRGPWVGMVMLLLVFVMTGPYPIGRLLKVLIFGAMVSLVLLQFPVGQFLFDLLPFIGKSETGSVDYREDLLTVALPVVGRNFWFGSTNYLLAPEFQSMYSGGIIDIVNTYLAVALQYGMVGLGFFVGGFVLAAVQTFQSLRKIRREDHLALLLGRSLLAVLLSIMLVIYTVSSIGAVPLLYWIVIGICVAFCHMVRIQPVPSSVFGKQS